MVQTVPGKAIVLAVDDVADNLFVLQGLLESERVSVLTARSASEALEVLRTNDCAVALIDVNMPVIDGFALAQAVHANARTAAVPIIFMTPSARDPGRVLKGYEAGAVDFLFKPFDTHILASKVAVFVQLHLQKKQLWL